MPGSPFRSPFNQLRPQTVAPALACPTALSTSPDWIAASARQQMAAWNAACAAGKAVLQANPHAFTGPPYNAYNRARHLWTQFLLFLAPQYPALANCLGDWGNQIAIIKWVQSGEGPATVSFGGLAPSAPSPRASVPVAVPARAGAPGVPVSYAGVAGQAFTGACLHAYNSLPPSDRQRVDAVVGPALTMLRAGNSAGAYAVLAQGYGQFMVQYPDIYSCLVQMARAAQLSHQRPPPQRFGGA